MALFVLYNEPLKMLADAPYVYESDSVVTRFLSKIPTTWDDTRVLSGKIGEYILMVRKSGNTWYGAAITNETSKELTLDCSFLGEGNYSATIFSDGINADKVGTDYAVTEENINQSKVVKLHLEASGGVLFRIEEKR